MTKSQKSDSLKKSKVTKEGLLKEVARLEMNRRLLQEKVSDLVCDSIKLEVRLNRLTILIAALALVTAFSTIRTLAK